MTRRSYSGLMRQPAWLLLDATGAVVASVRAESAHTARDIFRRHGWAGARVQSAKLWEAQHRAPEHVAAEVVGAGLEPKHVGRGFLEVADRGGVEAACAYARLIVTAAQEQS